MSAVVQQFDANGLPVNEQDVTPEQARAEWLESRKSVIGASDGAAILGISPWSTAYEVWLDKTNRITDWQGNSATRAGQAFERAVLDEAEIDLGLLNRNVRVVHPELPIASTLDAQVADSLSPVEAKTTGIVGRVYGDWGEALTDQIPDYYLIQVHTQLLVTGAELGYLFALIAGRGVVKYQIERSDAVCSQLARIYSEWWEKHVVRDVPPELKSAPALELVQRFRKIPKKTIVFDLATAELVAKRESLKEQAKSIKEEIETTEAAILLALGDAEAAALPDGRTLTHFETKNKGYAVEPFSYRSIRISNPKNGKK